MLKGPTGDVDGAALGRDGTLSAAGRTGLLVAQELGLLRGGLFKGAGGQAAGRGLRDLLHMAQIDIQPRSLVPVGAADDDSAPVLGDLADAVQIFSSQLPCTHDKIILEVRALCRVELPNAYATSCPLPRKVRPALLSPARLYLPLTHPPCRVEFSNPYGA